MLDDPTTQATLERIFPLLPWALERMQNGIDELIFGDLEPGTKATVAHNLVMREGERRFSEGQGIDVVNSQGLLHFASPESLIRIKHAQPRTLRIATNRTAQTFEWTGQLCLDGIADPRERLHLVYVPDPFWSRIQRSVVAVYVGNEAREWRDIDVDSWYEAGGPQINPFTPEIALPPLTLKPGISTLPLEEADGSA